MRKVLRGAGAVGGAVFGEAEDAAAKPAAAVAVAVVAVVALAGRAAAAPPPLPHALPLAVGLLLLALLAATSFNAAIRWLGAKRWRNLHRSVYAVAALSLLHFFWMRAGKNDFAEVAVYAAILAALLGWRVQQALKKRQRTEHVGA